MATLYVRQGEPRGLTLARSAIDEVAELRSQRARDRLLPLADALDARRLDDLARMLGGWRQRRCDAQESCGAGEEE
jgi:hypothetical protein